MFQRLINPLFCNSFFIFGARGVGKSTFISSLQLNGAILYVDLLDVEQEELYAKKPKMLENEIVTQQPEWVIIDEVQKNPKILNIAHRLIEKNKQKFILLGSSARKLKRGLGNLLAGRAYVHEMYPLTTEEIGSTFDINYVLEWGSLPKIFTTSSDLERKRFLKSYAQTYVKEEIQQEQIVRKLDPFRLFLDVAAQSSGKIINIHAIAQEAGCDDKTIANYCQILEATYLGFFLPAFHQSIRKSQRLKPKFYFFDIGVKRVLDQTLGMRAAPKTSFYGELFEHWIIQEIHRMNSYLEYDYRLSYLQMRNASEIDLILTKPKKSILIEIKSSDTINEPAVHKLAKLSKDFKDGDVKAYYLSQSKTRVTIQGVQCWHWRDWLENEFK